MKRVEEIKRRLLNLDWQYAFDDGCDAEDEMQNEGYTAFCEELDSIHYDLANLKPDGITPDELDRLWADAWSGSPHLPEVKYNHAFSYIAALEAAINGSTLATAPVPETAAPKPALPAMLLGEFKKYSNWELKAVYTPNLRMVWPHSGAMSSDNPRIVTSLNPGTIAFKWFPSKLLENIYNKVPFDYSGFDEWPDYEEEKE